MKEQSLVRTSLEWVFAIAIALCIFGLAMVFIGRPYRVKNTNLNDLKKKGELIWVKDHNTGVSLDDNLSTWNENDPLKRGTLVLYEFNSPNENSDFKLKGLARVLGLPGDTLRIYNGLTYINGKEFRLKNQEIHRYEISFKEKITALSFKQSFNIIEVFNFNYDSVNASTTADFAAVQSDALNCAGVLPTTEFKRKIEREPNPLIFQTGMEKQNADNYGPVFIPQKGDSAELHQYWTNLNYLKNNESNLDSDSIVIHTFQENYYFLMVDYRIKGNDSRFFGAIPASEIKGLVD